MGLVRISNPRKLRRLAERVDAPVIAAYSRWFENQRDLLVFTTDVTAWCVPHDGTIESVPGLRVWRDDQGRVKGVQRTDHISFDRRTP